MRKLALLAGAVSAGLICVALAQPARQGAPATGRAEGEALVKTMRDLLESYRKEQSAGARRLGFEEIELQRRIATVEIELDPASEVPILKNLLAGAEQWLALMESRFKAGMLSQSELLQAKCSVAEVRYQLSKAQDRARQAGGR